MPNKNAGRTVEEIRNTPKPQEARKPNEFVVVGSGGKTYTRTAEGAEKLKRETPGMEATQAAEQANIQAQKRGLQTNAGQTVKEQPKVRQDTSSSRGQMSVERSNAGQVAQTPTQITREAPIDLTADEIVAGVRQGTLSREQVSQVLQSDPRKARLVRNLMTAQRGVEMIENERKIQGYSTPDKLIEGVTSGVVNDADLMYIKETNPELYNQYQQAQENRYDVLTANMLAGNKPEDQLTSLAAIQNYYMKEFEKLADERKSAKEIRDEVMDTKESQKLFENVTALDDEIEQLQITIEGIEDDVRKEYPGDVTESFIQAQIAKRTKDLQPKVRRLLSEREKAALDYNNYISQSQVDYQLRLEEQRYSDAQKENMLQMQYGMTLQTFEKNWSLAMNELEQEQKKYWNKKEFDQQLALFEYKEKRGEQATKDFMKREYDWKKSTGQLDKDNIKWFQSDDGIIGLNTETGEFEFNFSPNAVAGFQFDMDVTRTGDNVGVDINNPGNITVRGGDPSTIANYGKQIGAIGTYKSPNGREYYVFDSLESGSRALRNDLKAKTSGKSEFVKPTDSLAKLIKVYSGDSSVDTGYGKSILQSLGITKEGAALPISYFDSDELSEAFAQADSGIDISGLGFSQARPIGAEEVPTPVEIRRFNSNTFKPETLKRGSDEWERYQKHVSELNRIQSDPNSSIEDILYYSQGGKELAVGQIESLSKYRESFTAVSELTTKLLEGQTEAGEDLSPIIGRLRNINARDVDAQTINAITTSAVPGLARSVYGEVGVLTDADVERYRSTLPNITQPEELRKVVAAMTLNRIMNGYKSMLADMAASQRDVSGYLGTYKGLQQMHNSMMMEIGATDTQVESEYDILIRQN